MLTGERKRVILDRLARDRRVVAKSLAVEIGVSEDTLRRDLRELARNGALQRVHGGALPVSPAVADYAARQSILSEEKLRLATRAAELVAPGAVVFVDGGTTNLALVKSLAPSLQATVVTHSPAIAMALVDHPGIEVELVGGTLMRHSVVCVGTLAAERLQQLRPDMFFLGVTGLHPEFGGTTGKAEDAAIKSLVAARSGETVVIATSEKLGAASPYVVLPIEEIAAIVVPRDTAPSLAEALGRGGADIIAA